MGHLMYTAPMKDANAQDLRVADAQPGHWAERCLPVSVRPYARLMRIERPIGWWLLLLPCWWGLLLGQIALGGGVPNLWYALLFLIGAIVMRGAGCTLNDIADRDFDAKVERTRLRPIASGQVSVRQALFFLADSASSDSWCCCSSIGLPLPWVPHRSSSPPSIPS